MLSRGMQQLDGRRARDLPADEELQEEELWDHAPVEDDAKGEQEDEDRTTREADNDAEDGSDIDGTLGELEADFKLSKSEQDSRRREDVAAQTSGVGETGQGPTLPGQRGMAMPSRAVGPVAGPSGVHVLGQIDENLQMENIAMGTSMPINIPFMAMRRGQSMAVGAGDAEEDEEDGLPRGAARMAMTFVPPHMMTRQRDTYSMVSVEGTSPGAHAKRDQLRRRTAIMRATGFIERADSLSGSMAGTPRSFGVGSLAEMGRGGLSKALGSTSGSP